MNFFIDPASLINKENISLIIKDNIASSLFDIIKQGSIVETNLIEVSSSAENSLTGIFSLNGKLFTANIPESIYDEFTLGKAFDNNFNIPVKLQFESINGNTEGNNTEIIFKSLTGYSNQNIQKTLDLYNKVYSNNIESAVKSFFNGGLNPSIQSIAASIKGNFLFLHINFGSSFGQGSVILTSGLSYLRDNIYKDAPDKKKSLNTAKNQYMFMLETELTPLGHIKLFSYYSDKSISVKFQDCPEGAKNIINKNLHILKEMMSQEGITLSDISFNSAGDKNLNGGIASETFSNGKIINERI